MRNHGRDATQVGGTVTGFSLEQLLDLPQTTIVTENEFVDGRVTYQGPLARELLGQLDLGNSTSLTLTAANDFAVEVPTSDVIRYDVILALAADGKILSRRSKGPIWFMYPISDNPELKGDPVINTRLIWQLIRIEVN